MRLPFPAQVVAVLSGVAKHFPAGNRGTDKNITGVEDVNQTTHKKQTGERQGTERNKNICWNCTCPLDVWLIDRWTFRNYCPGCHVYLDEGYLYG